MHKFLTSFANISVFIPLLFMILHSKTKGKRTPRNSLIFRLKALYNQTVHIYLYELRKVRIPRYIEYIKQKRRIVRPEFNEFKTSVDYWECGKVKRYLIITKDGMFCKKCYTELKEVLAILFFYYKF